MVSSSVSRCCEYLTIAHAPLQNQVLQGQSHYLCLDVFHTVGAGEYLHKTNGISACAFAKQTKLSIISCRPTEFFLSLLFLFFFFFKAKISICNFKLSALLDISLQGHQSDTVLSRSCQHFINKETI